MLYTSAIFVISAICVLRFFFHPGKNICVIDQAWGQDGWILAKFVFAFFFLWNETKKKITRPISSHLDRTSFVNKGFIIWITPKNFAFAGTKRAIPIEQDRPSLPARVTNQNTGSLHLARSRSQPYDDNCVMIASLVIYWCFYFLRRHSPRCRFVCNTWKYQHLPRNRRRVCDPFWHDEERWLHTGMGILRF